jgi:S-adenosylmethionine hydrolase
MNHKIITLLTDFGTKDGYAGSMKGVIKSALPDADIVDISHDISPFDIDEAAYSVFNYYSSFPEGTIHLAVVDPGVGGSRKGIIVKTEKYYFIGPDNGIFKLIFSFEKNKVYTIIKDKFSISGNTFHGRDIFAPAAVKIAGGEDITSFSLADDSVHSPVDLYRYDKNKSQIETKAITVDRFGNIIIPFTKNDLLKIGKIINGVEVKNKYIDSISAYYDQFNTGRLLVLWNSRGFLEIAANRSSAAAVLGFNKHSDKIHIKLR